jgi:aminopeptidase N
MPIPVMRHAALSFLAMLASFDTPRVDGYVRQPLQVQHYRFALTLTDSTDRIEGEATVRLRFTGDPVATVMLDLADSTATRQGRGMRVRAVQRAGRSLAFAQRDDKLVITLDASARAGDGMELVVRYAGIPADGLQIKPNQHGDRGFFSDNWPDKAHHWLPTIDHISGKATMEMDVVAPASYQVISNGARVEDTDLANGRRRTVWRESVPIAPWLFVLGVGHFAVQHVGDYRGVPIETWVFAADRDAGFHDFAVPTKDVLAFYSEFIGPFSYEKLANVQSNSVSGGMEAASAIFYSAGSVNGTRPIRWRNVVIHEIAHQWFGDAVTESDWNDVWLSEGFAAYFTLLFIEPAYGRDEFSAGLRASRQTVLDFDAKQPTYRVVHENLTDMAQVTSAMTYQKGSWVLHMLRQQMGDDRFWAGIRDYYARYRNGSASTSDFRLAMERAAGVDLSAFFQQWLYRGGVPRLQGTWTWDRTTKQVIIELQQTQAGAPFRVPLEIGVIEAAGATARVSTVMLDGQHGRFTLAAAQEPTAVDLDPNVRLLFGGQLVHR